MTALRELTSASGSRRHTWTGRARIGSESTRLPPAGTPVTIVFWTWVAAPVAESASRRRSYPAMPRSPASISPLECSKSFDLVVERSIAGQPRDTPRMQRRRMGEQGRPEHRDLWARSAARGGGVLARLRARRGASFSAHGGPRGTGNDAPGRPMELGISRPKSVAQGASAFACGPRLRRGYLRGVALQI